MRTAHIVTTPHEVGDRVLALCGKKHKVKQVWVDIPEETPICRWCVDVAIHALDEADGVITKARTRLRLVTRGIVMLTDGLAPDGGLELDTIAEAADDYARERAAKRDRKANAELAKRTCTCVWTDVETFEVNPDCPIHGQQG